MKLFFEVHRLHASSAYWTENFIDLKNIFDFEEWQMWKISQKLSGDVRTHTSHWYIYFWCMAVGLQPLGSQSWRFASVTRPSAHTGRFSDFRQRDDCSPG
jgi:hypothetical protein